MNQTSKTLLSALIISLFSLATLQGYRVITQDSSSPQVLGDTTVKSVPCNVINDWQKTYCAGSTIPTFPTPTATGLSQPVTYYFSPQGYFNPKAEGSVNIKTNQTASPDYPNYEIWWGGFAGMKPNTKYQIFICSSTNCSTHTSAVFTTNSSGLVTALPNTPYSINVNKNSLTDIRIYQPLEPGKVVPTSAPDTCYMTSNSATPCLSSKFATATPTPTLRNPTPTLIKYPTPTGIGTTGFQLIRSCNSNGTLNFTVSGYLNPPPSYVNGIHYLVMNNTTGKYYHQGWQSGGNLPMHVAVSAAGYLMDTNTSSGLSEPTSPKNNYTIHFVNAAYETKIDWNSPAIASYSIPSSPGCPVSITVTPTPHL
jgi:hypothetical protein